MELQEKATKFKEQLQLIYPNDFEQVLNCLYSPTKQSFRITLVEETESILHELEVLGFKIQKGPFDNSWVVLDTPVGKKLSATQIFNDKKIYIQELSSMLPVLVLDPKSSEKIIDLCAAPGSKTSQIASIIGNTELHTNIYAVEKAKDRFFALKRNLADQGMSQINTIFSDAIGLDKKRPDMIEFFDKVLVDAPCTNESRINLNDSSTYKFWNPKKHKELSRVQKGVLITGYRLLKPGGTLVYSTCTFNPQENELVIDWFLDKYSDAQIEIINPSQYGIENYIEGFTEWKGKVLDSKIKKAVRVLPNEFFNGFFVVKIFKSHIIS